MCFGLCYVVAKLENKSPAKIWPPRTSNSDIISGCCPQYVRLAAVNGATLPSVLVLQHLLFLLVYTKRFFSGISILLILLTYQLIDFSLYCKVFIFVMGFLDNSYPPCFSFLDGPQNQTNFNNIGFWIPTLSWQFETNIFNYTAFLIATFSWELKTEIFSNFPAGF